ncbi:MAG: IS200/IS605 family element transposase accessory protein TnpB [Gammaproteobacteria bacterium]|nr:IS200/IS605 family element transposase accessory protein TnpB [Gammaproteobacteria bacterium]
MIRTIVKTAKVSRSTHVCLDAFLRQQTDLYNAGLQERIDCYEKTGKSITYLDQQKSLTEIRRGPDFSRYAAQPQRTALRTLDKGMKSFFRRVKNGEKPGFPRYKSRNRGIRSFEIPQPRFHGDSIKVKGIGRFRMDSVPESRIRLVRIVKSALRITVQFVVEIENVEARKTDAPIGVDLGLKDRAILSTGETVDAVRLDRRELKRLQRKVSRAERGSVSRRKKVNALRRECERVRIKESQSLHRVTSEIVRRHNRIAVEDLKIPNMMRNHCLARVIQEQQWGRFVDMLTYKAESAGGEVVRVDPKHTSTDCSVCGHRQKMPLEKRVFECGGCGVVMDRDANASRNILQRGLALAGWDMRPLASPGASENVRERYVAGLPGQDAEQYPSECYSWI